jgi:hypothetical protein
VTAPSFSENTILLREYFFDRHTQLRKSFSDQRDLITVAVAFTAGAGNLTRNLWRRHPPSNSREERRGTMTFSPWGLATQLEAKRV